MAERDLMHLHGRQVGVAAASAKRRPDATRNLVLVHEPGVLDWTDLDSIAREVHALAPDIEVFIVSNDLSSSTTRRWAARGPTLVFSPTALREFRPARGKVYSGALITKDIQLRRLADAGVPVPSFCILADHDVFDPDSLSSIVMLKSSGFSSHGRNMAMVRARDIAGSRWREHSVARAADRPIIVQKFIDTGPYPSHYRVLTFFGEPIFAFRTESIVPRPPLDASAERLAAGPFMAKHGQRRLIVPVEDDVLELAHQTFRAIPEVALHGCDIIREATTRRLYVLEINPGGNTWSFSSQWAALLRTELNLQDLSTQFDAWKTCARILIERVRSEAI
jgi:glutathione synthase/RimK-type ligase-like ATP-grasp enzyme